LKISATSKTVFRGARISLLKLFHLLWLFSRKNGIDAKHAKRIVKLQGYKSSWTWLHKYRRLVSSAGVVFDNSVTIHRMAVKSLRRINGKYFWNKRALVLAMVENGPSNTINKIYLKKGRFDITTNEMAIAIQIHTKPGIVVNASSYYESMREIFLNRIYIPIPSNKYQSVAKIMFLPNKHSLSHIKDPVFKNIQKSLNAWLDRKYKGGFACEHLQYYLDEYCFRINNKELIDKGFLFYKLINMAVKTNSTPYKSLIKNIRNQTDKYLRYIRYRATGRRQ